MPTASTTPPRYVPSFSREEKHDDVNAIIYLGEDPKPFAKAYSGKKRKPDFYFTFVNREQRDRHITQYLDGLRKAKEARAERSARRSAYQHQIKVGDIFYNSWGYEQTNIDFYEVVAVKPKRVVIRAIAAASVSGEEGFMTDRCVPCPGEFTGPELLKTPYGYYGADSLSFDYGAGVRWDGTPCRRSWYG